MTPIILYIVAVALFGLSALLSQNTSVHTRAGGDEIDRRRKRKLIARVLMVAALLSVVVGVSTQVFSTNAPAVLPIPDSGSSPSHLTPIVLGEPDTASLATNAPGIEAVPWEARSPALPTPSPTCSPRG
jgi:hypothetical protein